MKERPILFSGAMVRAILDGSKTQTRRLVKPQPPFGCDYVINGAGSHALCRSIENRSVLVPPTAKSTDNRLACPHGQPRDRLWVKETYSAHGEMGDWGRKSYRADMADGKEPHGLHWRPSIFMSRKASRITLEIESVRVERLNGISEADAKAEGIRAEEISVVRMVGKDGDNIYVRSYGHLWESINGEGSWAQNPWVWVIAFRKLETK